MELDVGRKSKPAESGARAARRADAALREQCLALMALPDISVSLSLYAAGILIGQANERARSGASGDMLAYAMSQQLRLLAEEGELQPLFEALPAVVPHRQAALEAMSGLVSDLGLPAGADFSRLDDAGRQLAEDPRLAAEFRAFITTRFTALWSCGGAGHAGRFLRLATSWFRARMLCAARRAAYGELSIAEVKRLLTALNDWEAQHPASPAAAGRADETLLHALSLL